MIIGVLMDMFFYTYCMVIGKLRESIGLVGEGLRRGCAHRVNVVWVAGAMGDMCLDEF